MHLYLVDLLLASAKAEAEFLMEFVAELEGEDFEGFITDFEENEIRPEDRLEDADIEAAEHMDETENIGDMPSLEELAFSALGISADSIPEDITESTDWAGMQEEPVLEPVQGNADDNGIDLSNMGEDDLISLLASTENLADIGDLLSKSKEETPIEGEDPFASFAENEMTGNGENSVEKKEKKM